MRKHERLIELPEPAFAVRLFGAYERHLKPLRKAFRVDIFVRQSQVKIVGGKAGVEEAAAAIERLMEIAERDGQVSDRDLEALIDRREESAESVSGGAGAAGQAGAGGTPATGRTLVPRLRDVVARSPGQESYRRMIEANDIVFAIGPAGTGKTFLAVAAAVGALRAGRVRRIVLARPAVEAGERLGFLPGDFQAKVNPYLRPLYDALNNLLEFGQLKRLIDTEVVEVCPLAYMRGRTLENAFIILDEGQNTTGDQMKMFLTRIGNESRTVVTGDVTQTDLPAGKTSGLVEAQHLFQGIPGIGICNLSRADIVRHPVVQRIVDAYEARDRLLGKKKR